MKVLSIAFLCAVTFVAIQASAQAPLNVPAITRVGVDDLGTHPFGVYDGTKENINLENNNLNLSIPLVSLPGRNGHNLDLRLIYDSNIYRLHVLGWTATPKPPHWVVSWAFLQQANQVDLGWHLNWPTLQSDGPTVLYAGGSGNNYVACINNSTVTLFDGSRHVFRANIGCTTPTFTIQSQIPVMDSEDPDGAQINVQDFSGNTVVTLRDGTKIYFTSPGSATGTAATKIIDASGNILSYSNGVITDTVGRQVSFSGSGMTYVDVNGTTQTIQFNSSGHSVTLPSSTGSFPTIINNQGLTYGASLLDSIVINSGSVSPQTYSFTYSSNGELTEVVYPHQGCTAYDYAPYVREYLEPLPASGEDEIDIPLLGVSAKHVSPTGQCGNPSAYYTTTYTATLGDVNNTKMSVLFPDNTVENHYFTGSSISQVEQGHGISAHEYKVDTISSTGKMMKEVLTTWTGGQSWDLPTSVNTTFYDSTGAALSTAGNATQYDSLTVLYEPFPYSGQGNTPSQPSPTSVSRYLNAPNLEKIYDYAAGTLPSTTILTQKITSYDYDTKPALLNSSARVFGKPAQTVLTGTAASPVFTANFWYDQSIPNAATGSQHQTIPTGTPRGNLTEVDRCTDDACTAALMLKTQYSYDDFGNLIQLTDPKGYQTNFSWTDSWDTSGGGTMVASCTPSPGSFAYVTTITNALSQSVTALYRPCTGALSEIFDSNPQPQETSYTFDSLGRVLSESLPDGGATTISYDDTNRVVTFERLRDTSGHQITSSSTYDGIGRIIQHSLIAPEGAETVEYGYDGRDRKVSQTNPHLPTSSPTDGTIQYALDGLGRTTQVTQADGSAVGTDYGSFPSITVTDEALKKRKTKTDGAGRMVQVIEDPAGMALESDYQYDAAGNLTCSEQHGGTTGTGCSSNPANDASSAWRVRRFTYDDASRLLTAKNPESGTISYTYDANGNVLTKTSPSPNSAPAGNHVTTTYAYDSLNRLTGKTYSDSYGSNPTTPAVQFGYDGVALTNCMIAPPGEPDTYPVGRNTSMCDGSGGTAWAHDPMGRVKQERRAIGATAVNHYVDYTFNPDGSLRVLQTPPMKQLNYAYDAAGRATQLIDSTDSINFATGATYAPPGQLAGMTLGTSIFAALTYNSRLQPLQLFYGTNTPPAPPALNSATCSSTVGNIMHKAYNFSFGSGDNGNVASISNCRDTTRTQGFTYDSLNRIANGQSTNSNKWGEAYTIDAWGNMSAIGSYNSKPHESLSGSAGVNNQLRLPGVNYDPAGNMISNGNASYVYDAENRLIFTSGTRYVYDGHGDRVEKCAGANPTAVCPTSGTSGTLYWRGTGADTLAETDLGGNDQEEYLFFNGQRIARRDTSSTGATIAVHYYFSDYLGSHGVVENATGTVCEQDVDYYPYGGIQNDYCSGTSVPQNYKFTGKERDSESGLDNFGARYNASTIGRFMTPDWAAKPTTVPYALFGDPQTLNLYSFDGNNPLSRVDADGHYEVNPSNCGDNAKCQKKWDKAINKFENRREKDLNSKKANVRAAAAAYGAKGEVNGVHLGFANLASQGINGSVDPFGSTLGSTNIQVTLDFGRAGSAETQTHEGTHVMDDKKFLDSFNPLTGGYDQTLNPTHGQTEFNAFKAGAEVNQEHGFGPNDNQKILNFLHNSPVYGPIFNNPVFDPAKFPAQSWPSGWPYGPYD